MKTCPVCHAVAFDDAETCYGCLYSFANGTIATTQSRPRQKRPRHESAEIGTATLSSGGDAGFIVPYEDELEPVEILDVPYDYLPAEDERASPLAQQPVATLQGLPPFTFQVSLVPIAGQDGKWTWSCAIEAMHR